MGYILEQHLRTTTPNNAAPGVDPLVVGPWNKSGDRDTFEYGRDTDFHMQQTNWELRQGDVQFTFADDFYNRIYVIPPQLEYGTFAIDKTINVSIWNAYLRSVVFESSVPDDGSEVFMGGPTLPFNFNPLQITVFPFTALGEGGLVLTDNFTLSFDSLDVIQVPVTGFRPPRTADILWPFKPNWGQPFSISYEFKTDIIESEDGQEQRSQLRQSPRKKISFTSDARTADQRRVLHRVMNTNQKARFYVPEWTRYETLETELGAGETIAEVSALPWWIAEGRSIVLVNGDQMGVRRLGVVGEDSNSTALVMNFDSIDEIDWPSGTRVYPAIISYVKDEVGSSWITNYVTTIPVEFSAFPGLEVPEEDFGTAEATFIGRELFLRKPNWADPIATTNVHPTIVFNPEIGRIDRRRNIEFNKLRLQLAYVGRDFEDSEFFRKFFYRNAGRLGEFYMPTWAHDIDIFGGFLDIDTRIAIAGEEFAEAYSTDESRAGVMIRLHDGTMIFREIDEIIAEDDSNGDTYSYINFTETLGQSVTLDEIDRVSWVNLWRFSSDLFTVVWHTNSVCEFTFTVETLYQKQADIDDSNSGSTA